MALEQRRGNELPEQDQRGRPRKVLPRRSIYGLTRPYNDQVMPKYTQSRLDESLGEDSDSGSLVNTDDPRLSDSRTPTGPAGGHLAGTYPNPTIVAGLFDYFTQPIVGLTGTTETLQLSDARKLITLTNAGAITLNVPTNASVAFPVGTVIDIAQLGAGQVTVAGAAPPTILGTPGLKLRAQNSKGQLVKIATNTWLLSGDLAA